MSKELKKEIENNIVGIYDNDTIEKIIEYLQKRVEKIKEQLEEENNEYTNGKKEN